MHTLTFLSLHDLHDNEILLLLGCEFTALDLFCKSFALLGRVLDLAMEINAIA